MEEFKIFKFQGIELEYKSLLEMLKDGKEFEKNYRLISYQRKMNTYVLKYNKNSAYIYKDSINIIIFHMRKTSK